jgi:predicted ABC-type transport system involved in lysophospholipase L1 biosynthesis ATPase subunit
VKRFHPGDFTLRGSCVKLFGKIGTADLSIQILEDLNLFVATGETLAIVG